MDYFFSNEYCDIGGSFEVSGFQVDTGGFGYQPYAELKVYSAPEGGKIDSVKELLQVGEILRASD
jgi:hypothetical protein